MNQRHEIPTQKRTDISAFLPDSIAFQVSGAERRTLEKELAALDRKIAKQQGVLNELHAQMATHDQSDYEGLAQLAQQAQTIESEVTELEDRWLEVTELLD